MVDLAKARTERDELAGIALTAVQLLTAPYSAGGRRASELVPAEIRTLIDRLDEATR